MNEEVNAQNESRRVRLMIIINEHFGEDFDAVVRAIRMATGQTVSVRSVQAWLIDPRRASHRKVPEWALRGLEEYVAHPENRDELQRNVERAEKQRVEPSQSFAWPDRVRSSKAVGFATSELEERARHQVKWRELLGKSSGDAVHEALWAKDSEIGSLSSAFAAVARAVHVASSFDEFKRLADEGIREVELTRVHVREARIALERGADVFSNEEGLPGS